jgi:hypothetical protein
VATFTDGQNLSLAIPVSYLTALIAGIKGEVGPLPRQPTKDEKRSVIGDLGGPSTQGVIGENFQWMYPRLEDGRYSFSLRNQLHEAVGHVQFLVISRDAKGHPVDYDWLEDDPVVVQGQLAKRVTDLRVDGSVQRLTRKVEIRVLDFRFVQ